MCNVDEANVDTGVRPLTAATEATIAWADQTLEGCGHGHTDQVGGRTKGATQD